MIAFQTGGDLRSVKRRWVSRSGIPLDTTEFAINGNYSSLSSSGRYVAFDDNRPGIGRQAWITDLARQVTSQVTRGGTDFVFRPVWTPDERQVIFRRGERIYATAADGTTAETPIGELKGRPVSVSPDGRFLVYETNELGGLFIAALQNGGAPVRVGTPGAISRDGRISPDGRFIAFTSDESGNNEVYIQALSPARGRIQVSRSGGRQPHWSPHVVSCSSSIPIDFSWLPAFS